MAKLFYVKLVGEDKYYKHPFVIEDDSITLQMFMKNTLSKEFIELKNNDGYENIPNGWRSVPKIQLVPTSNILSFHEDEEYQEWIDKEKERLAKREEALRKFWSKYESLGKKEKRRAERKLSFKYIWNEGKGIKKIETLRTDIILEELDKL